MQPTSDPDAVRAFIGELGQMRDDAEQAPDTTYKTGYVQALDDVWELMELWLLED